jgi:hypothetical protein
MSMEKEEFENAPCVRILVVARVVGPHASTVTATEMKKEEPFGGKGALRGSVAPVTAVSIA